MAEKKYTLEMVGEMLREAGTLIIVFAPLYQLFEPHTPRWSIVIAIVILGVAALAVLREWFAASKPADGEAPNASERRRREWEYRKQRRWSFAAAFLCLAVILMFTAEFVYARTAAAPVQATQLTPQDGMVEIPTSGLLDSDLHFYSAGVNGKSVRFFVIRRGSGEYIAALDACQICGWSGYRQQGQNVICRNCGAAIYIPSIGEKGGCNPVPFPSHVEGGEVIVDLSALAGAALKIPS